MKAESSMKLSKEIAVAAAKKPYTKPALKIFGAVSELTNGSGNSCNDGHAGKGLTVNGKHGTYCK
jgi:hypothetical protein